MLSALLSESSRKTGGAGRITGLKVVPTFPCAHRRPSLFRLQHLPRSDHFEETASPFCPHEPIVPNEISYSDFAQVLETLRHRCRNRFGREHFWEFAALDTVPFQFERTWHFRRAPAATPRSTFVRVKVPCAATHSPNAAVAPERQPSQELFRITPIPMALRSRSGYFKRAFSARSFVLNGFDSGVNWPSMYLNSSHCSMILGMKLYSTFALRARRLPFARRSCPFRKACARSGATFPERAPGSCASAARARPRSPSRSFRSNCASWSATEFRCPQLEARRAREEAKQVRRVSA
jgi:hypothetical protein